MLVKGNINLFDLQKISLLLTPLTQISGAPTYSRTYALAISNNILDALDGVGADNRQ